MKKNYRNWIFALLWMSSIGSLQAQTADMLAVDTTQVDTAEVALPWPQNLQARLDSLTKDRMFNSTQLGLMVYDLTDDSTLYRFNARQTMRPASTMKLLTSISALDHLGARYDFRTSLYYTGSVKDSVLIGDLYCVGGMDPLFDTNDMKAFTESIKALGIHTLRGKIVEVRGFKDSDLLGEGWCWDDDNPTLSPLLIDKKDEFASRLVQMLDKDSIFVDGPSTTGTLPKDALLLCSRSHKLVDVLEPMMKNSDNLYAESMFYQLGAATGASPAKASHGRQMILKTLQKAGVTGQYKIADGSGLSLYNYVTPELLAKLLIYAYRKSAIIRNLYVSLPIAGEDGTLKKRMKDSPAHLNVRAKTGTVTGVSSLSGYVRASNGNLLAFAIINNGNLRTATGHNFQDRVCQILAK